MGNSLRSRSVRISGKTKLYGIIGDPVEHSLSPLFQSRFIEQSGEDAAYLPFRVDPVDIESAMNGLWALNVRGFNVTVPHKESVIPYVQMDACAEAIGAVNTVTRGDSGWLATNTDWIGFARALEAVGAEVVGSTALVFGAGGTARAVAYALAQGGISHLYLCNRSRERAERLASHIREHYSHFQCGLVEWGDKDVEAASLKANIVINTTSIGLKGEQEFPFVLAGEGVAVDAVYRPDGKTAFCNAANVSGRRSVDGLPMLIAQGAASFEKWFGGGMPDLLDAVRWIESELSRIAADLPGWEKTV